MWCLLLTILFLCVIIHLSKQNVGSKKNMEVCMSKKGKNSVSNNIKLITKQEMVLIKNSEEAKNTDIYGNLYSCLEAYTDLTKSKLNKDLVFDSKARVTLTNNKKLLMKNIEDEWYSKSSCLVATSDVFCQLCGTKNKFVCYIVNRLNGIELNVGRDCVTYFKTINGLDTVISSLHRAQRDHKKDTRRIEFEVREGDQIGFLKQAESTLAKFPILLPYNLSCDLKNTLADCNRAKNIYIKDGCNINEAFETFSTLRENFEYLHKKALKYFEAVKDHPLICNRNLATWIINNYPHVQEVVEKNDGFLNEESLRYIYEPDFVRSKIPVFKAHFDSSDVKIIGVEGDVIRFFIKNDMYFQPVTFIVTIKDFMKHIGSKCLTNNHYKYINKNLLCAKIENTGTNFDTIYNSIVSVLKSNGYDFIIDSKTSQAYWEKRQSRTVAFRRRAVAIPDAPIYKKTSKEELLKLLSNYLFEEDLLKQSSYILAREIDTSGRWITKSEKDLNARIAAEAAGRRKQKEFIPY